MWRWLKTLWRVASWRDRAEKAEARVEQLRAYVSCEEKRYAELCDRLLGMRFSAIDHMDGRKEYRLQLHFSEYEVRQAKGTVEQIVGRYGAWVRERFEDEMLKVLSAGRGDG